MSVIPSFIDGHYSTQTLSVALGSSTLMESHSNGGMSMGYGRYIPTALSPDINTD